MNNIKIHDKLEAVDLDGRKYVPIVYTRWFNREDFGVLFASLKEQFGDDFAVVDSVAFVLEEKLDVVDDAIDAFIKEMDLGTIEEKIKAKMEEKKPKLGI